MSDDTSHSLPARRDTSAPAESREDSSVLSTSDFWQRYGWNTTYSLCVGIGAFGLLRLLFGLVYMPTHPVLDAFEVLALFGLGPLLVLAGITGFALPIHSLVRHHWFDDERILE
jgi:hypothetical protein